MGAEIIVVALMEVIVETALICQDFSLGLICWEVRTDTAWNQSCDVPVESHLRKPHDFGSKLMLLEDRPELCTFFCGRVQ